MKKNLPATAALLFGMLTTAAHALDLTPHEITITEEGPPVQRFYFQDESRQLSFKIDNQMMASGSSTSVSFRFRDLSTAGMKLSKSPLPASLPFEEKNAETYRTSARTFIPKEAAAVQLENEAPDALAINGWTSRQFTFTYTLFGVPYRSTVTFVNFNAQEQFVFDVSGAVADQGKAYARSYRVLNSLGELKKASSTGPS